jgi:hypothetical protein
VRDVAVYPSAGKLVIGLRVGKAPDDKTTIGSASDGKNVDTDSDEGPWVYLTGGLQVDSDGHAVRLSDLGVTIGDEGLAPLINPIVAQLRDRMSIDYGVAYQNLLNAANEKLMRPLKDGFRMEGHLDRAALDKVYLPADGIVIAVHASGELKIVYGL